MSAEADSGQIEAPRGRPRLLPGVLGLVVVDGVIWLLGRFASIDSGFLIVIALILPIAYVAWLILRARDLLRDPQRLHPLDAWMCRWSGPLALCMFVVEFGCMALTDVLPEWKMLQPPRVFALLHHVAEWGLLFSWLCLLGGPRLGRGSNRIWKLVAAPLLLIFVLEFVLWALFQLPSDNPDTQPAAAARLWDKDASMQYHVEPPAPVAQVDRATVS